MWHPQGSRNRFVLATDAPGLKARLERNPVTDDMAELRREIVLEIRPVAFDPTGPVFTDDRSPLGPVYRPAFRPRSDPLRAGEP